MPILRPKTIREKMNFENENAQKYNHLVNYYQRLKTSTSQGCPQVSLNLSFCDRINGVSMAPEGSWVHAPKDTFILGIKELAESDSSIPQTHIYFAHAYKVSIQCTLNA